VHRRLTVYFAGDKVERVEKEGENTAPRTEPFAPAGRAGS
jgi:hypothetical protein